jgi:putative Ca2+/H+ antiporter (TMEM165/GDT1 family)
MDAVLLALLLGLALDQGDRSQRLARSLSPAALLPVCIIVVIGALVSALLGLAVAPYLRGPAGLLFFAIALVLGAIGLLMPGGSAGPVERPTPSRLKLYGQLLLHRLADRSSFLLVGVSAMTGNVWATAIGGTLGGLGALLPPLLAGAAYERAMPMRVIRPLLGAVLLIAGLACGLSALGLL